MDASLYWKRKILLALHDPPDKPFFMKPDTGGHAKRASDIFKRLLAIRFSGENRGTELSHYYKSADFASSGADRPVVNRPRKSGGGVPRCDFKTHPAFTHPLDRERAIRLRLQAFSGEAKPEEETSEQVRLALRRLERLDNGDDPAGEDEIPAPLREIDDPRELEKLYWWIWRSFREELARPEDELPGVREALWDHMPADSRAPDHSIWEHLRVTSALAFLGRKDAERHPYLMAVSLGPVGEFVGQARTSRDLWMGSFLLSELALAAMEPFIEHYGPDCIIYPDLRGNVRMDRYLADYRRQEVGESVLGDPSTFAALIPNSFVAVVPRGGKGHLLDLADLGEKARQSVKERWRALAGRVKKWLGDKLGDFSQWGDLWDRQVEAENVPVGVSWTAYAWELGKNDERLDPADLRTLSPEPLPAQTPRTDAGSKEARKRLDRREERLGTWMDRRIWSHYERARRVFLRVNPAYIHNERGFDYALVHHNLRVRHAQRLFSPPWPEGGAARGEKCTLCGVRSALGSRPEGRRRLDEERDAVRRIWRDQRLDPDQSGADRLCAICATKRFLVEASAPEGSAEDRSGEDAAGIGRIVFGDGWKDEIDKDGRFRVPFPSTSTVALQEFQVWAATSSEVASLRRRLLDALRELEMPRTTFIRALPTLKRGEVAVPDRDGQELLKHEVQYLLPETYDALFRHERTEERRELLGEACRNAHELWRKAKTSVAQPQTRQPVPKSKRVDDSDAGGESSLRMDKRIAVIAIDGDDMSRLLVGDPKKIHARWRDILHPEFVSDMEMRLRGEGPSHLKSLEWMNDAGWPKLLDSPRLMGPSLQAFVSRALALYANLLVPWVVEREFSGRLIYAGGDDILALAPAADALPLAARLQQLFSAAWILDTTPDERPWPCRSNSMEGAPSAAANANGPLASARAARKHARRRFQILHPSAEHESLELPPRADMLEGHIADGDSGRDVRLQSGYRLVPMLGRGQSVSAGVAIGHFKSPLGALVREARRAQAQEAKGHLGGAAFAASVYARAGQKLAFALPWAGLGARYESEEGEGRAGGYEVVRRVIAGFETGAIPARLPYKLEELSASAMACGDFSARARWLPKLLRQVWEPPAEAHEFAQAVLVLWGHGLARDESDRATPGARGPADGLLLCRDLAGTGEEP